MPDGKSYLGEAPGRFLTLCSGRSLDTERRVFMKSDHGQNRWEPGIIVLKLGRVLYKVGGAFRTFVKHTNQAHKDKRTINTRAGQTNLPLDILLDTCKVRTWNENERNTLREGRCRRRSVTRLQGNARSHAF